MQKLSNYILEKLKIDKNIKTGLKGIFKYADDFYDILNIDDNRDTIKRWIKDENIDKFVVYYRIDIKNTKNIPYSFDKFIENEDKVTGQIKSNNNFNDNIYLYKSQNYSILTNRARSSLIFIDKRFRKEDWNNEEQDIYFLIEPCKD